LRCGLAALLLFLLALLLFEFWVGHRLEGELEAVSKQGETLSLEALLETPLNGENASRALDSAGALLRLAPSDAASFDTVARLPLDRPPSEEERAAIERLLAEPRHRMALEILDRHRGLRAARYLDGDGDGPGLPARTEGYLDDRTPMLRLAVLLRARAASAVADGAPQEAYGDILLHLRIGDWLRREMPLAVGHLMANGLADRGLELLEQLPHVAPPADPEPLLTALARLDEGLPSDSLRGERAYLYQMMRHRGQLEMFYGASESSGTLSHLYSRFWGERGETAAYLGAFRETLEHFERPPTERGPWHWRRLRTSPFGIPAEFLIPNLLESVLRNEEIRARAAMAQYTLERLHNPTATLPLDPFSAEPFRLENEDGSASLLSPGRDLEPGTEDDLRWRLVPQEAQGKTTAASSS
jgi:hypothetical protein